MSALPSPLKSPTLTSVQVTAGDHLPHIVVLKPEPVDSPTHHNPVEGSRPITSAVPSPSKSPVATSVQFTAGDPLLPRTRVSPGSLPFSLGLNGRPRQRR